MQHHTGNSQPAISQEEHEGGIMPPTKRVLPYGYDGSAKNLFFVDSNGTQRSIVTIASNINASFGGNVTLNPSSAFIGLTTTTIGSSPTLFAVVNTAVAGQSSIVLDTGTNWIGLATTVIGSAPTIYAVVNTAAAAQASIVLDTGTKFIGLVTVANTVPVTGTFYQTTQPVSLLGQATLNSSPNFIGLVSTASIQGKVQLVANSGVDIGDVDILSIAAGNNNIGDIDVASIAAGNNNIGNVDIDTLPALVAGTAQIGSVTIANQPPLTTGSAWIGLATVMGGIKNAGTTKSLEMKSFGISASGNATIFVPTTEFHITHLLLSSDATVRVAILSGTTYLAGNASVGISLAPLGGWVENGSVDTPIYEGLANAAAFVINSSATTNIGGKVVYYEE